MDSVEGSLPEDLDQVWSTFDILWAKLQCANTFAGSV